MAKHHNHLFETITKENSAVMTLSDKAGKAPTVKWIVATGTRGIAYGVTAYARMNGLDTADVEFSYANLAEAA